MSVWRDGRVAGDDDVPLADDRAFLLGDGLFETVLVRAGRAALLARHAQRLLASGRALGVAVPPGIGEIAAEALPLLWEREGAPARAALRITVSRGRGRGLASAHAPVSPVLQLTALPPAAGGEPARPVRAVVVRFPRIDPADPLAGHKTLSAMPRVQARRAAREAGADVALLATTGGDVCTADAANLFVVVSGRVLTPPLDRGVLPGITRRRVLDALAEHGVPAEEAPIDARRLADAEEAFLTSSLDGVTPLASVGGRTLDAPGGVARRLARCI